jgi:hypothetical protein
MMISMHSKQARFVLVSVIILSVISFHMFCLIYESFPVPVPIPYRINIQINLLRHPISFPSKSKVVYHVTPLATPSQTNGEWNTRNCFSTPAKTFTETPPAMRPLKTEHGNSRSKETPGQPSGIPAPAISAEPKMSERIQTAHRPQIVSQRKQGHGPGP